MKSQKIVAYGEPLEAIEEANPKPTGSQVLVLVSHCGVCHSRCGRARPGARAGRRARSCTARTCSQRSCTASPACRPPFPNSFPAPHPLPTPRTGCCDIITARCASRRSTVRTHIINISIREIEVKAPPLLIRQ